jgi:hypothetical protein
MKSDMKSTRILPTLTQIVKPRQRVPSPLADQTALVDLIVARALTGLAGPIRAVAEEVISQQLIALQTNLQSQIEVAVHDAVVKAIHSMSSLSEPGA